MIKLQKLIVLSHGRTGSTFLIKALNCHPDFDMKRELLFNTPQGRPSVNDQTWENGTDSWDFLEKNLFGPREDTKSIVGFKLFYFHARNGDADKSVWRQIESDPSIKLVTLHRQNLFAGYVSLKRAQKSQIWHPGQDVTEYQKAVSLTIDAKDAVKYIMSHRGYHELGRDIVKDKAHLAVSYEDFQVDANGTLSNIVDFAGGQHQQVDWHTFKPGSANNERTIIDNLADVAKELALLDAEWMIAPFLPTKA
jgi:LPS sulfotransferase NodH